MNKKEIVWKKNIHKEIQDDLKQYGLIKILCIWHF